MILERYGDGKITVTFKCDRCPNEVPLYMEPLLTEAVQNAKLEHPTPLWFKNLCDLQEKVQDLVRSFNE